MPSIQYFLIIYFSNFSTLTYFTFLLLKGFSNVISIFSEEETEVPRSYDFPTLSQLIVLSVSMQ